MTASAEKMRAWTGPAILAYGFRPFFFGAAIWAALAMVFWVPMLSGLVMLPTAFDPVSWHAHEFLYGYLGAVSKRFRYFEYFSGDREYYDIAADPYQLDNLIAILDYNTLQITGHTRDVMSTEPVAEKWRAFGWNVREVNGHDYAELTAAMADPAVPGQPTFIIAHTIKGKGVSFMENVARWHHGVPSEREFEQAIAELEHREVAS